MQLMKTKLDLVKYPLKKGEIEENFYWLRDIYEAEDLQDIIDLMDSLREDLVISGKRFCGLETAPAAKRNHHAFEGGLVVHLLEMLYFHQLMEPFLVRNVKLSADEWFSKELIMRAIFFHDLHKSYKEFVHISESAYLDLGEWNVEYSDDAKAGLLTPVAKTLWLIKEVYSVEPISEVLMNAIITDHGGWSELKPKHTSVLGKYVYLLDEMSGNVFNRLLTEEYVGNGLYLGQTEEVK